MEPIHRSRRLMAAAADMLLVVISNDFQLKTRSGWLLSAAVALTTAPVLADSPPRTGDNPRIAAAQPPVTSRSIRLRTARETRLVVTAIAADPRGELVAAAGDDHSIRILRAATLAEIKTIDGHRDVVRTLCFDASGQKLGSAGNDGQLMVWDREQAFQLHKAWQGTPALAQVRCSPVGSSLAAVGFDNEVYIMGGPAKRPRFECDCRDLRAVAYRGDGRLLAVAGRSGDLHLFDLKDGRLISDHRLHRSRIHDLAFHGESNQVISVGDDGRLTIFDSDRGEVIDEVAVTSSKLFTVARLNETLVATAGSDNAIYIVDTRRGVVTRTLTGHHGSVSALASAGDWLFSGSYDATLQRWSLAAIVGSGQRIAEGDTKLDR